MSVFGLSHCCALKLEVTILNLLNFPIQNVNLRQTATLDFLFNLETKLLNLWAASIPMQFRVHSSGIQA